MELSVRALASELHGMFVGGFFLMAVFGVMLELFRLHVLHHACEEPIFGLGMIEELARHGYRLSPGTLYPLLDGLEKKGLLRSSRRLADGRIRRFYRATPAGRKALKMAKQRVKELFGELFEEGL
jgi:PadR family transcriptional regulator